MPDNLCMDTFIRSYMDVEGFVPIALVSSYQNVACFGALIQDIIARLQETAQMSRLEVDAVNETVRLKDGWDMVSTALLKDIGGFYLVIYRFKKIVV